MAWTDKPTDGQIGAWANLTQWVLPLDVQKLAAKWLREKADRKQASEEVGRVRELYIDRKLDKRKCFDNEVWDGFGPKEKYEREEEEIRRKVLEKFKNVRF